LKNKSNDTLTVKHSFLEKLFNLIKIQQMQYVFLMSFAKLRCGIVNLRQQLA